MPKQLIAYLEGDIPSSNVVDELRAVIERLAAEGRWSREPPEFVDDIDESSRTQSEDQPIRTVGVLVIVSAPGEHPPTPVEDATRVMDALAAFSKQQGVQFEVEFNGQLIGGIGANGPDRFIREGLLDPW